MKENSNEILLGMKENRNGGPSFQPSSFVVLSSTSLALPKWVWSLLAMGFLLLSSLAFFIWPGCGFPGYKEENSRMKSSNWKLSEQQCLSPPYFIFLAVFRFLRIDLWLSPADGINPSSAAPPLSLWLVLTASFCCSLVTIRSLALSNTDLMTIESS